MRLPQTIRQRRESDANGWLWSRDSASHHGNRLARSKPGGACLFLTRAGEPQFLAFGGSSGYVSPKNMPRALQDITHDVLELSRNQRLALAQFLLNLDDEGAAADVDGAWDA